MDPATLVGIVLAFGAVFGSMIMEGGSPAALFLPAPLLLVFVGTIGAGVAGGMLKDSIGVIGTLKKALLSKPQDSRGDRSSCWSAWPSSARREGLLALEDAVKGIDDAFLQQGLQTAIDGADPEELGDILDGQIQAKRAADKHAAKFFTDMGGYAPTIGIIGTVIGLVHVLENLSKPDELGHLIAGAFVATLWGVMTANVMWLPLASRAKRVSELECQQMELRGRGHPGDPVRHQPARRPAAPGQPAAAGVERRRTRHEHPRARAGKKHAVHEEEHENHERWLVSYADMMTLLMVLFIVLFAISQVDQRKFAALKDGLTAGFGASEKVPVNGGTGIIETDGVVPAPMSLDVGLGIKQDVTTGTNNRAYQSGGGSSSATGGSGGSGVTTAAAVKAARAELQKFATIERQIKASLKGSGLADKVRFQVTDRGLTVAIIADDVFFASASAELRPKGVTVLQSVGPVLAPLDNDIAVEGNANNLAIDSPIYPSNWELSGARASAVVRYLIANDSFAPSRLSATGFGSSRPLFAASDPRSVSYNRRVDLVVETTQPAAVRALLPSLGSGLSDLGSPESG